VILFKDQILRPAGHDRAPLICTRAIPDGSEGCGRRIATRPICVPFDDRRRVN
jgi:hypothetical protein